MVSSTPLAEQAHLDRAARHIVIGSALADAGDEWAAVPMFYSAYHFVKAALLVDPIWWDIQRLQGTRPDLIPDDRFTKRHHGHRQTGRPREWGINELVLVLYPSIARDYEQLHVASIDVRYHEGLPSGALPDLRAAMDRIRAASESGALTA